VKTKKYSTLINNNFIARLLKKCIAKTNKIIDSFSLTEKAIFLLFALIAIVSGIILLINLNQSFLVESPNKGGSINEGIIGTPRFINPIIAVSTADQNLTALIYSGLMRRDAEEGLVPDLAESYSISEDGLEYRFKIREDATFHDKTPVTTDDVIFTILKAQDPELDSSHRSQWEGVVIERINDREILFQLKEPYAGFLNNTTLGILPRHLWSDILSGGFSLSKYNTEPIGSGPYKLDRIRRDSTDIPISYSLKSFKNYSLGEPYIKEINFYFAKNESEIIEMFNNGKIDSFGGLSPETTSQIEDNSSNQIEVSLPRVFGVFFNQNESKALADNSVRSALNLITPQQEVIEEVLFGLAEPVNNAVPVSLDPNTNLSGSTVINGVSDEDFIGAQTILENAGWEKNEEGLYINESDDEKVLLSIDISTANISELVNVSEKVAENWRRLGVEVNVKPFEVSDLNQNVIRPRNFEALLFGMVIDDYSDLYAFWHSSQRTDPGLNITEYANITTDELLDELRTATVDRQKEIVTEFNNEISGDIPAIFLYTPKFTYVVPEKVRGIGIQNIERPSDRFMNVYEWFINVDKVWSIFVN
jgi:peptide/nickel transport system substrate-binding protein